MAIESPLFQSSMELLGHSLTHFNGTSELDRKLVILHLSNAIELLLKDMVLDGGGSIYKNPKETITVHGCIEALNQGKVLIPYINKIELLIDERNALQHRFGSPNELTAIFYMNVALEFFRTVLKDNYGQELDEVLSQFANEKDLVALKIREPSNDSELENLKRLAKAHPLGALLSAAAYLEKVLLEFGQKIGISTDPRRPALLPMSARYLEFNGIQLPPPLRDRLEDTRRLRNLAAHGRGDPTRDDVIAAISSIEELERFLTRLDIEEAKQQVVAARKQREATRSRYDSSRVLLPPHQYIYVALKDFLMAEPSLGDQKFMIDVSDGNVTVSRLPEKLPGSATTFRYEYSVNEKGDNIASEADRIKMQILKDCVTPTGDAKEADDPVTPGLMQSDEAR